MTGQRGRLGGDPLHEVAVGDDAVGVVIDDVVARRLKVAARKRSAIAMPTPLAKPCPRGPVVTSTPGACSRSGWPGVFDPSWRKFLQLVERQVVAGDVEQAVEQGRTVAGRENEAVAVGPFRILRVEMHELGEQDVGHGGGASGRPGWPELAAWTASMERMRMALMASVSSSRSSAGGATADKRTSSNAGVGFRRRSRVQRVHRDRPGLGLVP